MVRARPVQRITAASLPKRFTTPIAVVRPVGTVEIPVEVQHSSARSRENGGLALVVGVVCAATEHGRHTLLSDIKFVQVKTAMCDAPARATYVRQLARAGR